MWSIGVGLSLYLSLCSSAVKHVLQSCQIVMMSKCLTGLPVMLNFRWDCEGFQSRLLLHHFLSLTVPVGCGPQPPQEAGSYRNVWAFEDSERLPYSLASRLSPSPFLGTAAVPGNGEALPLAGCCCGAAQWAAQCSWSSCLDVAQLCCNSASTLASLRTFL